jgi:hypothetical protein
MPYANPLVRLEYSRRRTREKNRTMQERGRAVVREIKSSTPCADCRHKFHWCMMDFDHVRGKKLFTIGRLHIGCSINRLYREIAKCDVVCANCHRMRTFRRRYTKKRSDGTLVYNKKWQRGPQTQHTHCVHGHPLAGDNLGICKRSDRSTGCGYRRYCRTCRRESDARKRAKQKASRDNWLKKYSNGSPRKVPFKLASDGRLVLDRGEAH